MKHQDQNEAYRNVFAVMHMATQRIIVLSDRLASNVQKTTLHWSSQQGEVEDVRYYNCKGKRPASYEGYIIRTQLQQKLFSALRKRTIQPQPETQVH